MKRLTLLITLVLSFVIANSQCEDKLSLIVTAGAGYSQFGETNAHLELGILRSTPSWYVSFTSDMYTSKQDIDKEWTVLEYGGRFYSIAIKNELSSWVLFGEIKYSTMGPEKAAQGYSNMIYGGGLVYQHSMGNSWDNRGFYRVEASASLPKDMGRYRLSFYITGIL